MFIDLVIFDQIVDFNLRASGNVLIISRKFSQCMLTSTNGNWLRPILGGKAYYKIIQFIPR